MILFAFSSFAGVWEDNFNDGIADGWNEVFGEWSVDNGVYQRTDMVADYYKSVSDLTHLENFTLEADVTIVEKGADSTSVAAGVLLRTDETASSGYRFWLRGDTNGFQYSVWKDSKFTNIIDNPDEVATFGQMYHLKVQLQDFTFSAWVNDSIMVDNYVDPDQLFASGLICLINYNCHVEYDNLKVTSDEIAGAASAVSSTDNTDKLASEWGATKAR